MSLQTNQYILSNDVNDLIQRIERELRRRTKGITTLAPLNPADYNNTFEWRRYGLGNQNSINSSHINCYWQCLATTYGTDDNEITAYQVTSNGYVKLVKGQQYHQDTHFVYKVKYQYSYWDIAPASLVQRGILKYVWSVNLPSISSGTKVTAEDINALVECLNAINTDTYWNTSTAVVTGNIIQSIIEISNTLSKFENATDVKSYYNIETDQQNGVGSPPGDTSGCNTACKGLCQGCLGTAAGSSGSSDGCGSGGSSGGCDSCSSGCQGGCGGCSYTCTSSSN